MKKTEEGKFSDPILFGDSYHVFFVKKKSLVESSVYLNAKPRIQRQLYEKVSQKVIETWLAQESQKHYIKFF